MKGKEQMNNKQYSRAKERIDGIIETLPSALRREILSVAASRRDFYTALSEIRIRLEKESSVTVSGEMIRLVSEVGAADFAELFDTVTDGALYSHQRTLAEGYIPLADGVRLGVSGDFADGSLRSPTSLVFRIPCSRCEVAESLYSAWERAPQGMMIFSGVGGGKTSALRALADLISTRTAKRVVAIDERYEFLPDECRCADVLQGYGKAKGVEIAKRVLGAQVILVDELGGADEAPSALFGESGLHSDRTRVELKHFVVIDKHPHTLVTV